MGIISRARALFGITGVGQRERLTDCPSNDGGETKCTILDIDDSPLLLKTVKSILVKRGFNVLTSSSAPKGLDMIRYAARDIRIVVLDFSMPKLDGDETLRFIKQLNPNAKVIGLTAKKFGSLPREYIDGIDKLLSKPVIATTLIKVVCEVLEDGKTASSAMEPQP
jgi:CheY-like chemotaxis protein